MEKNVFAASSPTQQKFQYQIKLFNYCYRFWKDWESTEKYAFPNLEANSARSGFTMGIQEFSKNRENLQ